MIIEYIAPQREQTPISTITLEQYKIRRERRRKNVAKRMAAKYPLFAVEIMKDEHGFRDYNMEQFEKDIAGKRFTKYKRKGSEKYMKRFGKYELFKKAMLNFHQTNDSKFLIEAKKWKQNIHKKWKIEFRLNKDVKEYQFPATYSFSIIKQLMQYKFKSWEELDKYIDDICKYS